MKVKQLIEYLQKEYDPEDNIMIGHDLYYTWELEPEKICGTDKVKNHPCGYWCCKKPGHDGDCYCSFKSVYYNNDEGYDDDDDE